MNIEDVIAAHNKLRNEVGNLFLDHSPGVGENLPSRNSPGHPPSQVVSMEWGEGEKAKFNPQTRKCY